MVLIVTSHVTATSYLPGFTRYLAGSGWDVTVVCSPGPGLELLTGSAGGAGAGVGVTTVQMARDPHVPSDVRAEIRLVRTLRAIRPDVVVTATPKAGLLGTLAARATGVPLVVHLMWGVRSETLTGARARFVRALEGVATRFSDRVVANSPSLARELVRARMARPDRLTVLGAGSSHGVDTARFVPRPAEPSTEAAAIRRRLDDQGDGPVIGFVGRLTPDKGITTLVAAVERLRAEGRACRLLLVGPCEDDAVVRHVREAAARGLAVVLVDRMDDTRPAYHVMDVHCLPTLREGFPNVALEASACAVPTVTTDATGAVDSVVDGVTGSIARKDDVDSLAAALGEMLDDDERRQAMGRAARRWVEDEFEASTVWRRHEEYLRGLAGTDGRRVPVRLAPDTDGESG